MNWTAITVSMVENIHSTTPVDVTLAKWIAAVKRSDIQSPKKTRPALMPHGRFAGGRSERHCIQPSGLRQFDIDTKDNPHLNVEELKRRAAKVPSIVFLAKSATSGAYGFALDNYEDSTTMLDTIDAALGVVCDRTNSRSVTALRFASYDPQPYQHENIRRTIQQREGSAAR